MADKMEEIMEAEINKDEKKEIEDQKEKAIDKLKEAKKAVYEIIQALEKTEVNLRKYPNYAEYSEEITKRHEVINDIRLEIRKIIKKVEDKVNFV